MIFRFAVAKNMGKREVLLYSSFMSMRKPKRKERAGLMVRRSARGRGLGLFTEGEIPRGAFIVEYIGRIIPTSDADNINTKYLFEVDEKITIDGSLRSNKARYINHSCRPNAEAEIDGSRIFIYAKKKIREGEEIFYDYGDEYFEEFIQPNGCKCPACAPMNVRRVDN